MRVNLIEIILLSLFSLSCNAQVLFNGNFENSDNGWEDCLHEHGQETLYGGSNPFNSVMVIDGGRYWRKADDKKLCQTMTNFIVGHSYTLSLNASNVSNCVSTNPRAFIVDIDQGAFNQRIEVPLGTGFHTFVCNFSATQSIHELTIVPDFTDSCGIMLDNLEFVIVVSIELNFFTAELEKNKVLVRWETASEENSDYFIVERTSNGRDWENLRRIEAVGNSQSNQYYEMEDLNFSSGTSYYRLKEVDIDGNVSYSDIRAVTAKDDLGVTEIYPNPVQNQLFVKMSNAEETKPTIFNSVGKVIFVPFVQEDHAIILDTERVKDGIYFLQLSNNDIVQVRRFVVQH